VASPDRPTTDFLQCMGPKEKGTRFIGTPSASSSGTWQLQVRKNPVGIVNSGKYDRPEEVTIPCEPVKASQWRRIDPAGVAFRPCGSKYRSGGCGRLCQQQPVEGSREKQREKRRSRRRKEEERDVGRGERTSLSSFYNTKLATLIYSC